MLNMMIRKGQSGIQSKIADSQKGLLDMLGDKRSDDFRNNMTQPLVSFYQSFNRMMKQGILNFKYRENELKENTQRNLTHLMKGYEMYYWEIFQSLKVSYFHALLEKY